jgi:hypothetical protein
MTSVRTRFEAPPLEIRGSNGIQLDRVWKKRVQLARLARGARFAGAVGLLRYGPR